MSSFNNNVLGDRDANASITAAAAAAAAQGKPDVKSMEYHRQVLQSKMEQEKTKQYVSPSDNIMSPCSAKLNALRNKQVGKAKPKSLFAQASAKKLGSGSGSGNGGNGGNGGDSPFGAKTRNLGAPSAE